MTVQYDTVQYNIVPYGYRDVTRSRGITDDVMTGREHESRIGHKYQLLTSRDVQRKHTMVLESRRTYTSNKYCSNIAITTK